MPDLRHASIRSGNKLIVGQKRTTFTIELNEDETVCTVTRGDDEGPDASLEADDGDGERALPPGEQAVAKLQTGFTRTVKLTIKGLDGEIIITIGSD